VVNEHTIMVIPDNAQKRALYEEQVIRTFYISHADATEVAQILNTVIRIPQLAVAPQLVANKTNNTITVRASANIVQISRADHRAERQSAGRSRRRCPDPRGQPCADESLWAGLVELFRDGVFSPEADPRGAAATGTGTAAGTDASVLVTRPFNLNTITRGISTADFTSQCHRRSSGSLKPISETRLIAKPQLRGAEGQQITLNLGDDIPVPATVFTPVAQGGANFNPLTSFNYRTVGVIIQMTPRVTIEGDVILDLSVENSTRGQDVNIAGQNLPSFGSRKVTTRLRLRDGESNLLAGLLREQDRRFLQSVPGLLRLPSAQPCCVESTTFDQTDIVMLLTPRIVRTQELTPEDVAPIFIGTQQSLGLGGPPPLIAPVGGDVVPAPAPPLASLCSHRRNYPGTRCDGAACRQRRRGVVPPGSGQVPGTTTLPAAPAQPRRRSRLRHPQHRRVRPSADCACRRAASGADRWRPAAAPAAATGGQIIVSPPGAEFRVGAGPYTVPVSITGASLISGVSLTVTFNPSACAFARCRKGASCAPAACRRCLRRWWTPRLDASTLRSCAREMRPASRERVCWRGAV
jgi:hypothetical protein